MDACANGLSLKKLPKDWLTKARKKPHLDSRKSKAAEAALHLLLRFILETSELRLNIKTSNWKSVIKIANVR